MSLYSLDLEKKIIKLNHNVGFFSICTQNLRSIIGECTKHNIFFDLDTSSQWTYYKNNDDDVYEKFFKRTDDVFELKFENFTSSNDEEQFSDYSLLNYKFINPFVKNILV